MEERMVVSMLPFYQSGQVQEISPVAYDNLISAIVGQKRFNFVDRALVDKIVRELKLSAEQLVDPNYTLKVGKITGSEAMIIGFVKEAPSSIEVYAQLIDVESGLILEEKDAFNRDKSLEALKYLTRGLAIRLREDFPILEGKVVKADGKNITLDLGYAQKMKPGMRVIFFVDSEMKDAETGMNLGYTTDKIGLGKIVSVSDRTSVAEPIGKNAGVSPDKKVITK
jgi:DNA helicase TIP49 (TBP-interacting protein)